ncbi:MAG: hypothetical protein IJO08_01120 [Clostridia bacterium]|nr:hypothetical protein [Clostridia bacterium]
MNNKKINITYSVATWLIVQLIILSNIDYLGKTTSGGGFIPYYIGVIIYILIAVSLILLSIKIFRKTTKKDFESKHTVKLVLIVTVLTYFINLLLFGNLWN